MPGCQLKKISNPSRLDWVSAAANQPIYLLVRSQRLALLLGGVYLGTEAVCYQVLLCALTGANLR